jgi:hypothetical protein
MARRVAPMVAVERVEDPRLRLRPDSDLVDHGPDGDEHRGFPRAKVRLRVEARIGTEKHPRFTASFFSENVSVSGAFLHSTFFLPLGTQLDVRFGVDDTQEEITARAEVVREERSDGAADARSGMGIRFLGFDAQSEVALVRLFMGPRLRAFAESYLKSKRVKRLTTEVDRVIDALAAWEILQVRQPEDPWRPEGPAED